jgi:O-antigen/teichoic acid export membrane protein
MKDDLVRVAEDSTRGGFFLFSGTAAATVIMAIAAILVGRLLGPELYGQYTLVFTIPQLLFLFTDLGINQGVMKYAASFNARGETGRTIRIIKYALLLRALAGIVLFIINYAFADFLSSTIMHRPDIAFYMRIASTSILFQAVFTTATSAFVGLDKTEYNALTTNIQALAKTIIEITLVLLGFSVAGAVTGFAASYVVGAVAGAIILYLVLKQDSDRKSTQSLTSELKMLMQYGTPLYVSVLLIGLIPFYQNIVLANYTTDADVGNYKAAANFATLITVMSTPITTILLPAFSKIDSSAKHKINLFFKLANKYTTLLIIPFMTLIITFSAEIVQIIYGSTFQSASLYLATRSLVFLLVGLGYLTLTSFFSGLGETKTTMIVSLVTFLILVILSPLLTGTFGVQGLIAAFLIASTAGTIYATYKARRKFHIEFDTQSLVKIYIVSTMSIIPALLVLAFSPRGTSSLLKLAVGASLYVFIYVTLTPLTRIVTITELQSASLVIQRIRLLRIFAEPVLRYQKRILCRNWGASTEERTYISGDSPNTDRGSGKLNSKVVKRLFGGVLVLTAFVLAGIQILRIFNIYGASGNRLYFYGLVGVIGLVGIILIVWSFVNKETH